MTLFWSRLSLFWRFQLAGWAAFMIATLFLKLELTGNLSSAFYLCFVRDGSSFLLTLALRAFYRKFWTDQGGRAAVQIVLGCTSAGLLQAGLFFLLRKYFPLDGEIFHFRFIAFSVVYERIGLLYGWSFLYLGMRHALQGKQHQLELALAKSAQQGAELQMLRLQMSPHFLFNALNMIQVEVVRVNPALGRMIQSLADFLRFSLDHSQDELVSLVKEFEAARDYLQVEKMRLGEKLEFQCEMEEAAKTMGVPGIMLQPLVENAIKYGLDTSDTPLRIRIVVRCQAAAVEIAVSNTGHWLEPAPRQKNSHLGLQNLRRRLELLYPENHHLETIERNSWVTVALRIPVYEQSKTHPDRG